MFESLGLDNNPQTQIEESRNSQRMNDMPTGGLGLKVAAAGDATFISGFMMAGADGYELEGEVTSSTVLQLLARLIKTNEYAAIFLPERLVEQTQDLRLKLMKEGRMTPIFGFAPDYSNIKGKRATELRNIVNRAMGVEVVK